jgi:protein SCO1
MKKTWIISTLGVLMLLGGNTRLRAQGNAADSTGVDEKPGAQVALDAPLKDEDGKDVTLRRLIDKPSILTLNYFRCSGICTPLLNGLADAINQIPLEPGKDFLVITVSFDPLDTPEVASQKRINYLKQMKRPFPPAAWRFLTGTAQATRQVTDSVGFRFQAVDGGFTHAGVIMALSPQGKVSRYLYGMSFVPADLQMAIQEAATGQVRPSISPVLELCYTYDPQGKRYVLNVTRVAGAVILLLAGGYLFYLVAAGRSRKAGEKERMSV